jgi:hypothetical protein
MVDILDKYSILLLGFRGIDGDNGRRLPSSG